jgi:hypothetical protein
MRFGVSRHLLADRAGAPDHPTFPCPDDGRGQLDIDCDERPKAKRHRFIFFLQVGPVEESYLSVKDLNHIRQRSVGFRRPYGGKIMNGLGEPHGRWCWKLSLSA